MTAPTNTYNSSAKLALGNTPQGIDDPDLYEALLDLHNAIEGLATYTDDQANALAAYITKQRNNTEVSGDYTVAVTDGTIRVDASLGDVLITMHPVAGGPGFVYHIKRVDSVSSNTVTVVEDPGSGELIDGHVGGILLRPLSNRMLKSHSSGWDNL